MPDLDDPHPLLAAAQRFHEAVDAVAGQSENDRHAPVEKAVYEPLGGGDDALRHDGFLQGFGPGLLTATPCT